MIDPAFLGVARIGVLCRVEPGDTAAQATARQICERAVAVVSTRLRNGPPVVAFDDFDPRIGEAGTLLVTLHGGYAEGRLLLAVGLHRDGVPTGNLFPAPPQALNPADGAAMDLVLLALLERPVIAPLTPGPAVGGPLR